MKKCEWCGKNSVKIFKITQLGTTYSLCNECVTKAKNNICRVCGDKIYSNPVKGMCLSCAQMDHTERKREDEEIANVGDIETLGSPSELTDAEFEHWLKTRKIIKGCE